MTTPFLQCSLSLWLPRTSGSIYVHVGHARVELLTQELTHVVIATVEAEVRSSSVSVV